jgi:hypothetical protein
VSSLTFISFASLPLLRHWTPTDKSSCCYAFVCCSYEWSSLLKIIEFDLNDQRLVFSGSQKWDFRTVTFAGDSKLTRPKFKPKFNLSTHSFCDPARSWTSREKKLKFQINWNSPVKTRACCRKCVDLINGDFILTRFSQSKTNFKNFEIKMSDLFLYLATQADEFCTSDKAKDRQITSCCKIFYCSTFYAFYVRLTL